MKRLFVFIMLLTALISLHAQIFIDSGFNFCDLYRSSSAWGDYDNDGDLDVVISGSVGSHTSLCQTFLYRNDGNGIFTSVTCPFMGLRSGSASWGDYDNDGFIDLLLCGLYYETGVTYPVRETLLYNNNQDGSFTQVQTPFTAVSWPCIAWGDMDNDGDLDVVIGGVNSGLDFTSSDCSTHLYRNNGNGVFTLQDTPLPGISNGSASFCDYDNDGDQDLLLTGMYQTPNTLEYITKLYRNDGDFTFTDTGINLPNLYYGRAEWADSDNDGDADLLLYGIHGDNPNCCLSLHRNDGNDTFTMDSVIPPYRMNFGDIAWGDYNNDGYTDIVIAGYYMTVSDNWGSSIMRNMGQNNFTEVTSLNGADDVVTDWIDYDNDGDVDFFFCGGSTHANTMLYRNRSTTLNFPPSPPTNLYVSHDSTFVYFHWSPASDEHTPVNGLTYNLRIGTTPGGCEIVSPMSAADGYRRIPEPGYAHSECVWKIKRSAFTEGQPIYWSVQAVDTSFQGGAFAAEMAVDPLGADDNNNSSPLAPCRITGIYPNPAHQNSPVHLSVQVSKGSKATLSIYNLKGEVVKSYPDLRGDSQLQWQNNDCASGIYFCRLASKEGVSTGKVVLLR